MTLYTFSRLTSAIYKAPRIQNRPLFYWVTLAFNRVDENRVKELGPDRACAEWLLRNGASVQWKGAKEHVTDYNLLPVDGNCFIEAIYANNAGICDVGFEHLRGCEYVEEIKLEYCKYVDNKVMPYLSLVENSLKILEIISCKSVDENGLRKLKTLKNLTNLKIRLPAVTDTDPIQKELSEALPNCKIDIK